MENENTPRIRHAGVDPSIPVLQDEELPSGELHGAKDKWSHPARFYADRESGGETFYHCNRSCKGWIKGLPSETREDTSGPLAGRQGTVEHCIRCGSEVGFFGKVY